MKLYIPEIGDRFKLTADWTFDLWAEDRNTKFAQSYTGKDYETGWDYSGHHNSYRDLWRLTDGAYQLLATPKEKFVVILPAGTVLSVDRIYVRKGNSDFSSLSFRHIKGHGRFWAKLVDVNRIEFEPCEKD